MLRIVGEGPLAHESWPLPSAKGTSALVSDLGAIAELVDPGRTGWRFRAGDANHLASMIESILANPQTAAAMRPVVRAEFLSKFTAEQNYEMSMEIFKIARSNLMNAEGTATRAGLLRRTTPS